MADRVMQGWDITAANYASRPVSGQAMLYGTGSPDIKATPQMTEDYPWAVMTDQAPGIDDIDVTMDVYDVETGAIEIKNIGKIIRSARRMRLLRVRECQRMPLVYASETNLTPVCNVLDTAGLQGKCGLFVAHWGVSPAECAKRILTAAGPYPVRAMQNLNAGEFDRDLFSLEWLATSGQWNHSWTCHTQKWTLNELAEKLGVTVTALAPGNNLAHSVVTQWIHGNQKMIIPETAHFTYRKLPDTI